MNNEYKIFSIDKYKKIDKTEYDEKDECKKNSKKWGEEYQTNPRFKLFDQINFHAGDYKDINKFGLLILRYIYSNKKKSEKNTKVKSIKNSDSLLKIYRKIDYNSVNNTFKYIFDKFKKGIFIIIRDNKLLLFLPFSNVNYKNNWVTQTYFSEEEHKLLLSKKYESIKSKLNQDIIEFIKKHSDQFKGRKIDFNRERWYANNCVFRNHFPNYEGELNINVYKHLLETLLKERTVPDVEFFINPRDFPLLKKDFTEPYNHLFDSDSIKVEKEYQFDKMCPIFSQSATDKFADILFPTNDEWLMISNKFFLDSCSNGYTKNIWKNINTKWDEKKSVCIFRGGATGCGITIETNMRLKAANLSLDHKDILDAGITNWKARMRKYKNKAIDIIDPSKFRFKIANEIDNVEKSNYKYILNIDGYVSAFRLSSELSMNSVILLVKSEYKLWYSDLLKEYEHYIPIKENLEDLIEKIRWCINNDDECKKIANNGYKFYNKYLTKDGVFDYLENKFQLIHNNKNYNNLLGIKKSNKKIAIISCFRDKGDGKRESQRKIFIQTMNRLLEPICKFHIYIIEQSEDNELFNIGKLKNIGFEIAMNDYDYDNVIFSDIDTIPDYNLIKYIVKQYNYVLSLAIKGTRYEALDQSKQKPFLGALIQFKPDLFKKINGYPNNFWGWGGEDDSLLNRLILTKNNTIYYPKSGLIIDTEENDRMTIIEDIKEKLLMEQKELLKYEKLYEDIKNYDNNGINTLNYKILGLKKINENISQIKVDLLKKEDEEKYKEWFISKNINYNVLKQEIDKFWNNIIIEYV